METLPFYTMFWIFQIFREALDSALWIFENLHFGLLGVGGEAPETIESIKFLNEKSMEISNFGNFHQFQVNLYYYDANSSKD